MGFHHFDDGDNETFAAALLLLCVDEDEPFQCVFVRHVRRLAGLAGDTQLLDCGREEALEVGDGSRRRSDIWLRFEEGIVLVEIKTHSGWDAPSVAKQLTDQRQSECFGEKVQGAVLLAPGRLLRRRELAAVPKLSWQSVIELAESIPDSTRILQLAIAHWSDNVERDFGLATSTPVLPIDSASAQTACLVAMLRAAILRLNGTVRGDTVRFTSSDGRPRTKGEWTWFGVAVPGRLPKHGRVHVGIYSYTAGPTIGSFLEAYDGRDREIVSIPFAPADLSPDRLDGVLAAFADEYARRYPTQGAAAPSG